jgi:hypothetical protein
VKDVRGFLRSLLRTRKGERTLMLGLPVKKEHLLLVHRRRAQYAKELLQNEAFQDAIQFMNEQIVQELTATKALDSEALLVLRLRLEIVSEFPQVLWQFIDEYETIAAIKDQNERTVTDFEEIE